MLPLGAFVVAVLLNGVQILLPAPAFVEQGRAWAPARAIFQRLGDKVIWDAGTRTMSLEMGRLTAAFPLDQIPTIGGQPTRSGLAARRVNGTVYVPLLALRELGLRVHWDSQTRQVFLQRTTLTIPTTLAAVLADPPAHNGETVCLTGEYAGWDPHRFCFATRQGPPVTSGDWVLVNEDGAIYCTPGPAVTQAVPRAASLTPVSSPLPAFTPYTALGQRLTVTGTVRLTAQALPYLQFSSLSRPEGLAGVTCRLLLGRLQCAPGDRLHWSLRLGNPHPVRIALGDVPEVLVTVAGPDGNIYVFKQSFSPKGIGAEGLASGSEVAVEGSWEVPEGSAPGTYAIIARLSEDLGTYRSYFEVQSPTQRLEDEVRQGEVN